MSTGLAFIERVTFLKYRADLRTLVFVAAYFVVAAVPWFVKSSSVGVTSWLVAANCLLSFICACITHNTMHHPIFRVRWMNKVFQVVLSFTYGKPVSTYVPGHNLSHHKHLMELRDPFRPAKARFRWNLLNQLLFFFIVAGGYVKNEARFVRLTRGRRPTWFRQYVLESVLVFGSKLVLLLLDWKLCLLFVLLPHLYAGWGITGVNFWQHDGCDPGHPYNHSRNVVSKALNYLVFNNGYHAMHHNRMSLHWSLLPEWHRIHIEPNNHPALNQRSIVRYLWSSLVYPGKRVTFDGRPVQLPPALEDESWTEIVDLNADNSNLGAGAS